MNGLSAAAICRWKGSPLSAILRLSGCPPWPTDYLAELARIGLLHHPMGHSPLAGADWSRKPSANELDLARFQGRHVAGVAAKLTRQ